MHEYTARIEWRRLAAEPFTDNRYHRGHRLMFDGGTELAGSSSPQWCRCRCRTPPRSTLRRCLWPR